MTANVFTLYGRVHPERAYVTVSAEPLRLTAVLATGGQVDVRLLISNAHVIAEVMGEHSLAADDLRNMVQELAQSIVDCVGWEIGCSYVVEMSGGAGGGGMFGFGVSIPPLAAYERTVETRQLIGWLLADRSGDLLPLRIALADIRRAGLEPGNTPFHCFRAVEALMYSFGRNPRKGRKPMCDALRIDDRWIVEQLEVRAGSIRHGGFRHVSDSERADVLRAAIEVICRFIVLRRRGLEQLPDDFAQLSPQSAAASDGGEDSE